MTSHQQKLMDALLQLSGPLGPLGSLGQRELDRAQWHETLTENDAPFLVDLLYQPPDHDALGPASAGDFQQEVVEALAVITRQRPAEWLQTIERWLEQRGPNEGVIELLGSIGYAGGGRILAGLMRTADLSSPELIALACSLGEIGSSECRDALEEMRNVVSDPTSELAREIEIALAATRND